MSLRESATGNIECGCGAKRPRDCGYLGDEPDARYRDCLQGDESAQPTRDITRPDVTSTEWEIARDFLDRLPYDCDASERLTRYLGADTAGTIQISTEDDEFTCRLAHADDSRFLLFLDAPRQIGTKLRFSLVHAEAHAFQTEGRLWKISPPELARWRNRLATDAGLLAPPSIHLPPLPPKAPPAARALVEKVIHPLLQTRWLTESDSEPFSLSAPTMSRWFNVTSITIGTGKRWLTSNGWLVKTGERPSGFPKPTHLFTIPGAHRITGDSSQALAATAQCVVCDAGYDRNDPCVGPVTCVNCHSPSPPRAKPSRPGRHHKP